MPRRTSSSRTFVVTGASNVDAGDASGDVTTGILCPGDGAKVVDCSFTVRTAGSVTGSGTHTLTLEHGLGAAGVALTADTEASSATAAAGTIVTVDGLDSLAQPATVRGTVIQIKNVEGGTVTDGAFYDVSVVWQL